METFELDPAHRGAGWVVRTADRHKPGLVCDCLSHPFEIVPTLRIQINDDRRCTTRRRKD